MPTAQALKARGAPPQRREAKSDQKASGEERFLLELGEQVRAARARSGMTRKDLAAESGVSERYLAHLESGQGNISVLLLQKVAAALNLPLGQLLGGEDEPAVELTLIQQVLRRLPPQQLPKVRALLMREFGSKPLERIQRVALIGLRGAGKSTLGTLLAKQLGVPF